MMLGVPGQQPSASTPPSCPEDSHSSGSPTIRLFHWNSSDTCLRRRGSLEAMSTPYCSARSPATEHLTLQQTFVFTTSSSSSPVQTLPILITLITCSPGHCRNQCRIRGEGERLTRRAVCHCSTGLNNDYGCGGGKLRITSPKPNTPPLMVVVALECGSVN